LTVVGYGKTRPIAVREPANRTACRVGFVRDLPHDLLDDVLDRDDARRTAVLVDDDGELRPLALQICEQIVEGLRLRDDRRIPDQVLQVGVGPLGHQQLDELVDVDDALDPVGVVVLRHDEPRVSA